MKKQNLILSVALFVALVAISSLVTWVVLSERYDDRITALEEESQSLGYSESTIVDVIGTASAPYRFSAEAAASAFSTTSEIFYVGNDVNNLTFNIHSIEASSTMDVTLYIEQSNDAECTTTTDDGIDGIKWVDATPATATFQTATNTISFGLASGHGESYTINNWNAICAKLAVGSASSTVWVSASKQELYR